MFAFKRDLNHPFHSMVGILLLLTCFSQAADPEGTTESGEGNELVITSGTVIREVPRKEEGALPFIAVGTANGTHHLYNPNNLTMQGFWKGRFGHTNPSGEFVPYTDQLKSFSLDRTPVWTFSDHPRRLNTKHTWKGAEIRDGKVFFRYDLSCEEEDITWSVEETLEVATEQQQYLHFDIKPSKEHHDYLNYWVKQTDFRRLSTNGQQNQRNLIKNLHPNQTQFTISFLRRKETPTIPHGYSVREIDIPAATQPFRFEPTALDFAADGTAYVSTRTGGIWRRKGKVWNLFAEGLHEANGVQVAPNGSGVYVMQKPELTLLQDTDADGKADLYTTVEDRFRFTGQYHEFAYGPKMNRQGELFFSTGLSSSGHHMVTKTNPNQMTSPLGYRGWVMRKNLDGSLTPFASGLRSPAGIGMNAKDELFITDNQGDFVASSYLGHVEEGDFMGHPASLWDKPEYGLTPPSLDHNNSQVIPEKVPPLDKEQYAKSRKLPAVWLSHGDLTNSPGHPSFAPESGFGPFAGQVFIADIAHRNIIRVALEKINGRYQGAAFPFIRPLKSASYSTGFDPNGNLWVGSVGRGWTAGDPAIEVISFDQKSMPFEIHHISLTKIGFDIRFTMPLKDSAVSKKEIGVNSFRYEYWDGYGSELIDETIVPVTSTALSSDRKTLSIQIPLAIETVYQIQLPELKSDAGLILENNYGIYTLNQLLP